MRSFTSQASTETRVPGVSPGSIAANTLAPASRSSAVAKCWRTTAVPCASSNRTSNPVEFTPGGAPPASLTRATSSCIRSAVTSVNLTTRTRIGDLLTFDDPRRYLAGGEQVKGADEPDTAFGLYD